MDPNIGWTKVLLTTLGSSLFNSTSFTYLGQRPPHLLWLSILVVLKCRVCAPAPNQQKKKKKKTKWDKKPRDLPLLNFTFKKRIWEILYTNHLQAGNSKWWGPWSHNFWKNSHFFWEIYPFLDMVQNSQKPFFWNI